MCVTYTLKHTCSSLVGLAGVLLSVKGSCLCCDTGDEACMDPLVGEEILGVIFGVYHFIIRGLPLKVEPFLTTWVRETQAQKRIKKKSLDIVYSCGSAVCIKKKTSNTRVHMRRVSFTPLLNYILKWDRSSLIAFLSEMEIRATPTNHKQSRA